MDKRRAIVPAVPDVTPLSVQVGKCDGGEAAVLSVEADDGADLAGVQRKRSAINKDEFASGRGEENLIAAGIQAEVTGGGFECQTAEVGSNGRDVGSGWDDIDIGVAQTRRGVDDAKAKLAGGGRGIVVGVLHPGDGGGVVRREIRGAGASAESDGLVEDGSGDPAGFDLDVAGTGIDAEVSGGLAEIDVARQSFAIDQDIDGGFVGRSLHDPELGVTTTAAATTNAENCTDQREQRYSGLSIHVSSEMTSEITLRAEGAGAELRFS